MAKKKIYEDSDKELSNEIGDEIDQLFSSSEKDLDSNIDKLFDVEQEEEKEMNIDLDPLLAELSELVESGEKTIGFNELKKIIEEHEVEGEEKDEN